jgi:hypothetical protein
MHGLGRFTRAEWLTLHPLGHAWRRLRNDALLAVYRRQRPPELADWLAALAPLRGRDVALVVAFEQPWALDWQLAMAKLHLPGVAVLVFDNSRTPAARQQIREVCSRHATPYLALPRYRTRHVNRSHGMAMSWIYANVVRSVQPRIFGFLDHDLIPVQPVDLASMLRAQAVFGMLNDGKPGHWNLWAGYCFFRFEDTLGKPLNFLYDFSRGLDTGGRNWKTLYRFLDRKRLRFAPREFVELTVPALGASRPVEVIDKAWVHIGGVGYNDNFKTKFTWFDGLRSALRAGRQLADLRAGTAVK